MTNRPLGVDRQEPVRESTPARLEDTFERLLREYGPALSRLASGYERVDSLREELAQDIALAIWQALPHFRGESSERTFIYRIAHNRAMTHVFKRRPAHQSLDELTQAWEPVDPAPHPEEQAVVAHRKASLRTAIQRLPFAYRQVVMLMLEDLTHAEIGEVLGISQNNVALRMNRARKALKEALEERP